MVSDLARRADHLRVKHRLDKNWIKMYDKQQTVLRVETTLNDVKGGRPSADRKVRPAVPASGFPCARE